MGRFWVNDDNDYCYECYLPKFLLEYEKGNEQEFLQIMKGELTVESRRAEEAAKKPASEINPFDVPVSDEEPASEENPQDEE